MLDIIHWVNWAIKPQQKQSPLECLRKSLKCSYRLTKDLELFDLGVQQHSAKDVLQRGKCPNVSEKKKKKNGPFHRNMELLLFQTCFCTIHHVKAIINIIISLTELSPLAD